MPKVIFGIAALPPLLPQAVWINPPHPDKGLPTSLGLALVDAIQPGNRSHQDNRNEVTTETGDNIPTLSSFQESSASNSALPTRLLGYPSAPTELDVILTETRQLPTALPSTPLDAQ
jgi:hypothetical protein